MEGLYGMSLYCGIGYSIREIKKQIDIGAEVGINTLFTSLQLPEADLSEVIRHFPEMTEYAHSKGMKVEADIARKTESMFGISIFDLNAIEGTQFQSLFKDLYAVGGQADMADLAGCLSFLQCFQCAARCHDGINILLGGVVNLIQVDIIGAQIVQADLHILFHASLVTGHGFGGQDEVTTDTFQGISQVFLTDSVATGGVDKIDTGIL